MTFWWLWHSSGKPFATLHLLHCLVILLVWVQRLCINMLTYGLTKQDITLLFYQTSLLGKCSKTLSLFIRLIIRSMLKDMKDNIIIHHNIPFLSDIITRSMPRVIKYNITIWSFLIDENSLRLASAFFAIGSGSWISWGK